MKRANIDLNELLNPYYCMLDTFLNCESDSALAEALNIETELDNRELMYSIIKGEITLNEQ